MHCKTANDKNNALTNNDGMPQNALILKVSSIAKFEMKFTLGINELPKDSRVKRYPQK